MFNIFYFTITSFDLDVLQELLKMEKARLDRFKINFLKSCDEQMREFIIENREPYDNSMNRKKIVKQVVKQFFEGQFTEKIFNKIGSTKRDQFKLAY